MTNTLVIAEAGVNHNGSLDMAIQLVDAAAAAQADIVKFQTFKAQSLTSRSAPKAEYQLKKTSHTESQFEMIRKLELDEKAHLMIAQRCQEKGIKFLSTPFDLESVDLLVKKMKVSYLKIGSGDLTNAVLLHKAAASQTPMILSTGMSTLDEVKQALGVVAHGYLFSGQKPSKNSVQDFQMAFDSTEGQTVLKKNLTLLHCTTEYPAPFDEVNLNVMQTLKKSFGLAVGYSDHTPGIAIPIAAVAMGAVVIEKHFTLDRNLPGPDHKASLEPQELVAMVAAIRQVELATGSFEKKPAPSEVKNIVIARRSLVALIPIKKGDKFSENNLGLKRPATGLSPYKFWEYLDRPATRDYAEDELIEEMRT